MGLAARPGRAMPSAAAAALLALLALALAPSARGEETAAAPPDGNGGAPVGEAVPEESPERVQGMPLVPYVREIADAEQRYPIDRFLLAALVKQ